jgi:hypothetical protein
MTDLSPENTEISNDWQNLPLLSRNEVGKRLLPMRINLKNLNERVHGDSTKYANYIDKSNKTRTFLKIEVEDYKSVDQILAGVDTFTKKWQEGKIKGIKDYEPIATYLDWSYHQQVGVLASNSTIEEATKNGEGAVDALLLFMYIKNNLNG